MCRGAPFIPFQQDTKPMRIEKDALGEMPLPDGAYYGIQAFRSLSNFDVTDKTFNDYPAVVRALAEIKKACALANRDIGALGADKAGAIARRLRRHP